MEVYKVLVFAHSKRSGRYYSVATYSARAGCPANAADAVARKYRGDCETKAEFVVALDPTHGRNIAVRV